MKISRKPTTHSPLSYIRSKMELKNSAEHRENGTAFMMYFLMIPVLVYTMGFGMQVSINQYVRTTLQSSLDQATQSAVSLAENGGHANRNISLSAGIIDKAHSLYNINRINKVGGFVCPIAATEYRAAGDKIINPPSGCSYIESKATITYKYGKPFLRIETKNASKNIFGAVFGSNFQQYNIISEARITRSAN
jgi:hypothetical protein